MRCEVKTVWCKGHFQEIRTMTINRSLILLKPVAVALALSSMAAVALAQPFGPDRAVLEVPVRAGPVGECQDPA